MIHPEIVRMNVQNVDGVCGIEAECFLTPWSKASFVEDLENPLAHYLVALVDDQPAGFIGAWIVFDECHVMNVAVWPEYRHQGIASELLEKMIDDARKKGVLYFSLEVREGNSEAIQLYQKHGFYVNGRRKKYYTDSGEDALLMWRSEEDEI